jgi:hypothetical protein
MGSSKALVCVDLLVAVMKTVGVLLMTLEWPREPILRKGLMQVGVGDGGQSVRWITQGAVLCTFAKHCFFCVVWSLP